MSNPVDLRTIVTACSGVLLGAFLFWLVGAYLSYADLKDQRAHEQRARISLEALALKEAEIERVCEMVAVRPPGANYFAVEYRAKPGVSREEGFRVCGNSAFSNSPRVWAVSAPSTALGRNATAKAP